MKQSRRRHDETLSAALTQTLLGIFCCFVFLTLAAFAVDPSWWSNPGSGARPAVMAEQVVTNNGVVITNYVPNPNAVVTQGQLKQFTARAVDTMNTYLAGGAGTNLNDMVSNWSSDYATNGYNSTNIKPSDYAVMTVGQLKFVGNKVWAQLVVGGYTNAVPSWLAQNTNSDSDVAVLGQLKSVFNFDLSTMGSSGGGSAPVVVSNGPINGSVKVLLNYSISANNGPSGYSAIGLPPGLLLAGSTISGTPTVAGVYNVYVTATNSSGTGSAFIVFNITQSSGAPEINSSLVADAGVGNSFSYKITASNIPTQFGATGLPDGLSVNVASGVISGEVATAGTYAINLSATNSSGMGTATLVLTVTSGSSSGGGGAPVITSNLMASGNAGQSFVYQIAASNSPTSYGAVGLPDGLSINTATGLISGTPASGGEYSVLLSVATSMGSTSSYLILDIGYTTPTITSSTTANATVGISFTYTLTANNNPASYSVTGLPAGLSFDPGTDTISGIPAAVGISPIGLGATNTQGTGTATLILTVGPQGPLAITSPIVAYATINQAFSYSIGASGAPTSYGATGLPSGVSLNSSTGVISGTFTAVGTPNILLGATNSLGGVTAPLIVAVQASSGSVNAVTTFQAGVGPTPNYATTSAGIGKDSDNAAVANNPLGALIVGAASSTQIDRALLGFDLSPLPPEATITGASLTLQGASESTFNVQLFQTSAFDAQTANWTSNSTNDSTVLSSLAVQAVSGPETWPTSAQFVLAVQDQINSGAADSGPLYFMLVSTDAENAEETSGASEYLMLSDETQALVANRPALTLNYMTSSPPVIASVEEGLTVNAYVPYSFAVNAINGAASYSATGLPTGLSINSSTGIISGMVTTTGSSQVTISATNVNGTGSTTFPMTVVSTVPTEAPVFTSPMVAYAAVGNSFSYTTTIENGPATYSASGLPSGFSIDSTTGIISGTPTSDEVSASTIAVTATNAVGNATASLLLVIESNTSTTTATITLQDGVSPTSAYQTASAGIATDTSNSDIANESNGPLLVGMVTSTQTNQALLGFDLSVLPPDALIANAQLILNSEPTEYSSTPFNVNIYTPDSNDGLNELSDVYNATWSSANTYDPPSLSSLSITPPTSPTDETWPSTLDFSNAVQIALNSGAPLFLAVAASSITPGDYFEFDNEQVPISSSGTSTRPALLLTYTTAAPPVFTGTTTVTGTSGTSYNFPIGIPNGATSYTLTPALPSGLEVISINGVWYITGTADYTGTDMVIISSSNANGTSTDTLTFNLGNPPVITSGTIDTGTFGVPFCYRITANNVNGATPVYSATNLPEGLTINSNTGVISGTPTSGGNPAQIGLGVSTLYGQANSTLVITFAPTVASSTLTAYGNANDTFTFPSPFQNNPTSFTATGLSSLGQLSLDSNGNITGTLTTVIGGSQVVLTGSNSAGSVTATLTIVSDPLPVPTIATGTATAFEGETFSYTPTANIATNPNAGVVSATNFTNSPPLPAGLSINATNGTITGTLTGGITTASTSTYTITATDATGTGSGTLILSLEPPGPGIPQPLTAATDVGTDFSWRLFTIQQDAVSTSVINPPLPPGLSYQDYSSESYFYDGSVGEISGTPTTPGTYDVILAATDGNGNTSTGTLVITVGSITSPSTAVAQVGVPFNFTVSDSDNPSDFQASNLPQGLSINSTTGIISGTPLVAETIPITLAVTDAGGTSSGSLTLTVTPNPDDFSLSLQEGVSPSSTYNVPSANIEYDSANTATAGQIFTTGQLLTVGQITTTASSRALLAFNLSTLPANAVITGASLVMTTSSGDSSGVQMPVEVHQSDPAWSQASANWNNDNGYNSVVLDSQNIDPSAATGSITFPINPTFTSVVQQVYNQGSPLYLTLSAPSVEGTGAIDYVGFVTNGSNPTQNPQLVVTYEVTVPAKPVITSATTVTGTVNIPLTYTVTASNNPTQFLATGLPSGLSLNTSTGVITGTVTNVSSTVTTVGASNSTGTGTQAVTFNIDSATPATNLQVMDGNNQAGSPSTLLAQPLVVQATYNGNALANALVTFSVATGSGAFALTSTGSPTASTITAVTNSSGLANVYFFLPPSLGKVTVVATGGTAAPVSLVETVAASGLGTGTGTTTGDQAVVLSVISGEDQGGASGQTLPQPFLVQASSASGQAVIGASLNLSMICGGGGISSSASGPFAGSGTVTTNSSGQAVIYMQLGSASGADQASCEASEDGLTSKVYLTALNSNGSSSASPNPQPGTPPNNPQDPQAWNGSVYVMETDLYNYNYNGAPYPANPNPAYVTIYWTGNISNVAGYFIEKKVSTGSWEQLTTIDSSQTTNYSDPTTLLANETVQYRVTPYILKVSGVLGSPSAPVTYNVPLVTSLNLQTSSASDTPVCWPGFINILERYLTETQTQSSYQNYSTTDPYYEGVFQTSFNSTVTFVPTPDPTPVGLNPNAPVGTLDWTLYYNGFSQSSGWYSDSSGWSSTVANATEVPQPPEGFAFGGQWSGTTSTSDTSGSSGSSITGAARRRLG